jgi:hypothetical protein
MVTFGSGLPGPGGVMLPGFGLVDMTTAGPLPDRAAGREAVSSGWPALDRLLPGDGVRRGSLIEWFAGAAGTADAVGGCGAATLACVVACRLAAPCRTGRGPARGGMIVVVDRAGWFHPPAVLPWLVNGAGAGRLVVARPSRDDDEIWAIDQALRCVGVAAVVAWPRLAAAWSLERGAAARGGVARGSLCQWTTAMRRWQLAARSSGAVGLFVRSPAALHEPSWAESRLAVTTLSGGSLLDRRLRVERVGGAWCGSGAGRPVEIAIDLARGLSAGHAAAAAAMSPTPRRRESAQSDAGVEGGVSCRAS